MVKVTVGGACVIVCDTHNSQLQAFKSWDARLLYLHSLHSLYGE